MFVAVKVEVCAGVSVKVLVAVVVVAVFVGVFVECPSACNVGDLKTCQFGVSVGVKVDVNSSRCS